MTIEIIFCFISLTIAFFIAKVLVAFFSGFTSANEIISVFLITFAMFPVFSMLYPVLIECSIKSNSLLWLTLFILPIIYLIIEMLILQKSINRDIYYVNKVSICMNLFGFMAIAILFDFNLSIPNYFKYNMLYNPPLFLKSELASAFFVICCLSFTSYMILIKIFSKNEYESEKTDDIKCSIPQKWTEDAQNNFEVFSTVSMKSESFESIKKLIIQIIYWENERSNIRNEIIEFKSNIDKTIKNRFIYKILETDYIESKYSYIIKNRNLILELDKKICDKYEKLINYFPEEISAYQNKLNTK